jgi:hypothetical protein
MKNDQDKAAPPERKAFVVDHFRPEDAEGIVRLFRAVYGDHYPIRVFYDPGAVIKANNDSSYFSVVARLASGEVIGVAHLYPSAPCRCLYEWGVGLVSREYRNLGVNHRLAGFLCDEFVTRHPHIEELFGEPVCNHPYMQKAVATNGFVETALAIALMPAEVYVKEGSATGRVAALAAFRCYRPKPHRIYLPVSYEQELRWIYGRLDDTREIVSAEASAAVGETSQIQMAIFDFAHVARIAVHEIGTDLEECLETLEQKAVERKVVVFQIWLNLAQPLVGRAVVILRERGYFFGGALPRWFDSDGLLMQKLLCPPDFEGIVLESDFAGELLDAIKADWQRVRNAGD